MIRTKSLLSGGGGVLLLILVALDFAVLKGEEIFEVDVPANGSPPIGIPVDRVAEKHTLLLRTGGTYPLEWQLRDPQGREVVSKRDITSKQGIRRYSFRPLVAGDYRLTVSHRGTGSEWSRIDVAMRVNDRRTISAWLDFH
jgi:hypothetical protein